MTKPLKQIHLAAHFPGVNNTTVWSDPRSGSHIEFELVRALRPDRRAGQVRLPVPGRGAAAARAERPDLRPRRRRAPRHLHRAGRAGRGHRPPRAGRHDQLDVQRALRGGPAVRQPRPPVRRPGRLERGDLLGRLHRRELPARRLPGPGPALRAGRAPSWPRPRELFDSWHGDEIVADKESGTFLADPRPGAFAHHDAHFDISGQFNVPRSPQGRPVIFQAGDSDEGREFAAAAPTRSSAGTAPWRTGQAFYADVKGRLARYGRTPDQLLILPAATFVLGDTDAEAAEERPRTSGASRSAAQTAIKFLEQLWNRDLSGYDPDGPLPEIDPDRRREHHRPRPGQRADAPRPDRRRPPSGARSPRPRGTCRSAS